MFCRDGHRISMVRVEEQQGELVGTITLSRAAAVSVVIEGAQTALLIDELPVLAAIAPYTAGGLRGARRGGAAGEGVRSV